MRILRAFAILTTICLIQLAGNAIGSGTLFAEEESFRLIVHPHNSIKSIDQKVVNGFFLKKIKFWSDGEVVQPVDLSADSDTRASFSEAVLDRSAAAVKIYWQQMIFAGREIPPLEFPSDKAVLKYVSTHKNAIGYISTRTKPIGVKVIQIK